MSRIPPGSRPVAGSSSRSSRGLAQERGGDAEALAHPVRVGADPVLGAIAEADDLQRLLDPALGAVPVEGGEEIEVGATVQVGIERGRFDEPGDPLQRLDAGLGVAAEEAHAAGAGGDQAQHHPQRGGLAGAVGAEVAEDVAGPRR